MDRKVLVALLAEELDKLPLQFCFALIGFRAPFRRFIFCDHGVFARGRNDAEITHLNLPPLFLNGEQLLFTSLSVNFIKCHP